MAIELGRFAELLVPYIALMRQLVDGSVSHTEFRRAYHQHYLNEHADWPVEIFHVLDKVFAVSDNVVEDPRLRSTDGFEFSSEQLRECVIEALAALDPLA